MSEKQSFLDYKERLAEWLTTRKPPNSSVKSKNKRKKQRAVEMTADSPDYLQLKSGYELRAICKALPKPSSAGLQSESINEIGAELMKRRILSNPELWPWLQHN